MPVGDGEEMKVDGDARALGRVAALYGLNGVAVREREGEEDTHDGEDTGGVEGTSREERSSDPPG